MFKLTITTQFKKDFKLIKRRSVSDTESLTLFLKELAKSGAAGIDPKHRPHKLSGKYKDDWEAHVKPDLHLV
jgi:mRNA interferase YafQ